MKTKGQSPYKKEAGPRNGVHNPNPEGDKALHVISAKQPSNNLANVQTSRISDVPPNSRYLWNLALEVEQQYPYLGGYVIGKEPSLLKLVLENSTVPLFPNKINSRGQCMFSNEIGVPFPPFEL
ncbi:hypothetical protein OIU84_018862 [Salix udensis]|uniref:Uncharacterized protein n=1 Tax=Salix udensis TaxID=889485 RepID=A0AAD6KXI2_9ROSI|nr:hypothetical protein OIU84_018862 [Salix udensis]